MWRIDIDDVYWDKSAADKLAKFAPGSNWEFLPDRTRRRVVSRFEDSSDAFVVFRTETGISCVNVDDLNEDDWQWVMPELPAKAGDRVKAYGPNSEWRTVVAIWNDGDGFAMVTDWDARKVINFNQGNAYWVFSTSEAEVDELLP